MRDILFRGKSSNKNEWVYGYYVRLDNDHYIYTIESYCIEIETNSYENALIKTQINPKTLGQCTGLTDNNDILIFEGDILTHKSFIKNAVMGVVSFYEGAFIVGRTISNNALINHNTPKNIIAVTNIHDCNDYACKDTYKNKEAR